MTRQFDESINDDELRKLPLLQFEGRITLIDTYEKFRRAMQDIGKPDLLGFDTETRPSFKKGRRYQVALLQLADARRAWLFRLNMIGLPTELAALLADKSVTKTGVAIRDDLKALKALVLGGVVPTTVTLKLPLAVFSALSVAVQLTVVVPVGKVVPEAGVQFGVTAPSTRSVAEAVKVTTAPEASVDQDWKPSSWLAFTS